uniref:4-hydroxybenzoate octaprenyltransferase n=1 Tax=Archaeoglobus fulgidus TaxID=2234 RepID=A0A7J2TIF9_ARCFL
MKLKSYLEFIKIEHTLFALPFAYAGALIAGDIDPRTAFLIFTAFTGLRTFAMSFNRIIDREIDALNPRTAKRHLPAGIISLGEAYAIAFIGFAIYIISAFFINLTAFLFSPIPAVVAYIYPYLKRFTCLSHYFLGLNLALAPMGGWIAVRDSINFDSEILIFSISVIFWVSGFDIIYALQDIEFDRKFGLHSIGAHFGERFAKWVSRANHMIFLFLLALFFKKTILLLPVAALIFLEHYIVRKDYSEQKVQISFFYINAVISSIVLLFVILEYL